MSVDKTKVSRISRQQSPTEIMLFKKKKKQKKKQNKFDIVEYFK
jgi:hypothetical protein